MTDTVPTSRTVHVRAVTRAIGALPSGECRGYRIEFIDGEPRVTYNADQVTASELGSLVHDLVTARAVVV